MVFELKRMRVVQCVFAIVCVCVRIMLFRICTAFNNADDQAVVNQRDAVHSAHFNVCLINVSWVASTAMVRGLNAAAQIRNRTDPHAG